MSLKAKPRGFPEATNSQHTHVKQQTHQRETKKRKEKRERDKIAVFVCVRVAVR